jgi:hypothetical protein
MAEEKAAGTAPDNTNAGQAAGQAEGQKAEASQENGGFKTILGGTAEGQPGGGEQVGNVTDGKPADGEPAKKEAPAGAPEKYGDFTVPEGVVIAPEVKEKFSALAKEMNLTQEAAQKLVDMQSAAALEHQKQAVGAFAETVKGWEQETRNALGANFDREVSLAAKALDKYGSAELRKLLTDTGIGNHLELVKFMAAAGKVIAEDTFVQGATSSPEKKSIAARMFPNSK